MIQAMTEEQVRQNLADAGCHERLIGRYMAAMREGDRLQCSRLLESWRRVLLGEIHSAQRQLDCLDYLRYQLQKSL